MNVKKIARSLGWFSIGLGIAELMAPDRLARMLGIDEHNKLMRTFGGRELGPGVALVTMRRTAPWLWARVGGDAIDLVALGAAFRRSSKRIAVGAALAAVAGITVVDALTARKAMAMA